MAGLIFQRPRIVVAADRMSENYDGIDRGSARKVVAQLQEAVSAPLVPPPSCSYLLGVAGSESSFRDGSVA